MIDLHLVLPRRNTVACILPPVIAALLSCVFITVRPIANLSGSFAFLVSTLQFLYFYPAGTLSTLIESSALCFLGGVIALAYSDLILYFAILCNRHLPQGDSLPNETIGARLVCGFGLAIVALIAGWIRSTSPRLVNASRILVFHTIWTLVGTSDIREFTADRFLLLFYPTLWSALLSIVSLIIGHAILPPERKRLNDILGEALKGLAEGVRGSSNVQTAREPEVVAASDVLEDAGPDGAEEERHDEREEESATSSAQTAYSPPIQPAGESVSEKKAEAPVKATTYRPLVTLLPVIREHYSTALHGITYDPMSTRRLRPILTILYALIGRSPIVKTMAKNPNGAFSFELQPGGGKEQLAESLSGIRELIALGIEDSLRAIRESYDWHQDDSVSRPRLGGPLGFWQNHFAHHSRAVRKESDPLDPRRRVAQTQEALLSATWAYEHDLFTWLETGFFTLTPGRGMEITERDLKDRSRRDMARTLFVREKVRGRRGRRADSPNASGDASESDAPPSKTPLSKADLAKVQNERVKAAAWLVAILDLAKDVSSLCNASRELLNVACQNSEEGQFTLKMKRFYFPLFDVAWLERSNMQAGLQSDRWTQEVREMDRGDVDDAEAREEIREAAEHEQRLARQLSTDRRRSFDAENEKSAPWDKIRCRSRVSPKGMLKRSKLMFLKWWESDGTLSRRLKLSRTLSDFKHSRHIQYAFKLALGVMLLALPGLLPLGGGSRRYFIDSRGQWSIISYMYVLDVTTGATFRLGVWRVIGTVSGAVVGYVGYLMSRGTPYGLSAVSTIASIPIAWLMLFSSTPGIGIVAGITLPPILFIPYLERESDHGALIVALWRAAQIVIGIVGAFLVNLFVFPYHARTRYHKVVAQTLDTLGDLYLTMSRENLRPSLVNRIPGDQYAGLERSIEIGIAQCRSLTTIQQLEISLLPKPFKLHVQLNNNLAKIYDLLVEIRTIRQGIPRRETVLDVLPLRQSLVTSVYVVMFAVAHAARSRTPLPQFMSSPIEAVHAWATAVEEHLNSGTRSRSRSPSSRNEVESTIATRTTSPELAVLYACAEREALYQLSHSVVDLLNTARALFGVQSFLFQPRLQHVDEEEILYR